jgi:hypothetical protein
MAAHVTGQQARAFLDARARDFWADFEPTPQGDVLYRFPMRSPAPHHRTGRSQVAYGYSHLSPRMCGQSRHLVTSS